MTDIISLWNDQLPPYPDAQLALIQDAVPEALYQICGCFWLYRFLHLQESPLAVLMGDYCFGRFSFHLAKMDSVMLTDSFASYLRNDTLKCRDLNDYLCFIRQLSEMEEHECK